MYFTTLTAEEFQQFTKENFSHYTQSSRHFQYRNINQKDSHLVGLKDSSDNVIAACLLNEARCLRYFRYFYTHRGPVMDYSDMKFASLTKYLRKLKCIYVLVDPYLLESIRETDGEIIDKYNNKVLIKELAKLGYIHQGYSTDYSQMSQIRWLSVLDLKDKTETQILNEMDYQTRRNIKKTYEMGVQVRTLSIDETPAFFELFRMAEEKHGFKFRELEYFKQMQHTYGNRAFLKMAYVDLHNYLNKLNEKQNELVSELNKINAKLEESPNSKKTKSKLNQLKQQEASNNRKINETKDLIKTKGDTLNLAAALYLYNEHEVYYLSSGSNPEYNQFMGAYRLQWEMIKFAKKNHIDRYNFYGVTGDFSDNAEDYGVQRFKEGFNAYIEEYIGDFIKPVRPLIYKLYQITEKARHK
ncbi:aminoacyltransferase [Staphylococcus carnosus]|uniref:aminoacyltransferase n=1 Tax=Staphylococcus carnosus TaxID=1281 RepID=UPI000CD12BBA|nr:aminoacyltransferase [Staphylococcus carnosus]POA06206.1 aminoacyltransferase [Staphylococcus carnosus]QRQ04672.1 aminoacyltransferase [Staphylococcus carnosus]UTB83329.1 methicillin resistance protein [Staphylococcus carnosus]SUM05626.1 fmhA protein [Staphylococcus carnosus]GEP79817.1 methicillin resistance protein [Staphylococcus carnosus]